MPDAGAVESVGAGARFTSGCTVFARWRFPRDTESVVGYTALIGTTRPRRAQLLDLAVTMPVPARTHLYDDLRPAEPRTPPVRHRRPTRAHPLRARPLRARWWQATQESHP